MKKGLGKVLVMLMCMLFALTGCGNNAEAPKDAENMKVGFIYIGPAGDGGWSDSHDKGRIYLEEKLGVQTLMQESVPEDAEVKKVATSMIDQGCKVIFATSFGYMDFIEEMSKEYPDVKFFHCSGYKTADNMTAYFGRMYEARYLTGMVAGMQTKANNIGYVAAFDIPEVVRGINAFTMGVRAVNPEATVKVMWTSTWYDPAKEKEAAIALLDQGVDVIAQHQDTPGPQQAAEERGVWSIGYNSDMQEQAPKANMTSAVWNWGPYYVKCVQSVMDGTYQSESYWGGLKDGIVNIVPLTNVAPEAAKAKVEEANEAIKNGELHPFAGPVKNQQGEVVVPEGETMTDEQMLSFDWFVEGVEGTIGAEK